MRHILNGSLVLISLTAALSPAFSQSVRQKYGARDPKTCASQKDPLQGALSSAQAAEYFICERERVQVPTLYLLSDVKIEVAPKGRPFNIRTDSFSHIDPSQPVYDARGSFVRYLCNPIGSVNGEPGRNCNAYPEPNATGMCFKDTFGDWHCKLSDRSAGFTNARYHVPPPQ